MEALSAEDRSRLDRRVQVVGGKGGVGRTTIACAMASSAARRGRRTLLLEVNAMGSAARRLGVEPSLDVPREVRDNLWLCDMTPAGSLEEYALLVVRFRLVYQLVFENRLVKYMLRSIPSLAELTMAGKFWYHSTERLSDGSPKYERIIVDAPATGHAITFLAASRTTADIVPAGRMKRESEKMAELIEDPDDTCLHIVTLPEEMPVNEALELEQAAVSKLRMSLGVGFVNRHPGEWLGRTEESCVRRMHPAPPITGILEAAKARLQRIDRAETETDRLRQASRLSYVPVPDFDALPEGQAGVDEVVAWYETLFGREGLGATG